MAVWIGKELELTADASGCWTLVEHAYTVSQKTGLPVDHERRRYYGTLQQAARALTERAACALVSERTWTSLDDAVSALATRLSDLTASLTTIE